MKLAGFYDDTKIKYSFVFNKISPLEYADKKDDYAKIFKKKVRMVLPYDDEVQRWLGFRGPVCIGNRDSELSVAIAELAKSYVE